MPNYLERVAISGSRRGVQAKPPASVPPRLVMQVRERSNEEIGEVVEEVVDTGPAMGGALRVESIRPHLEHRSVETLVVDTPPTLGTAPEVIPEPVAESQVDSPAPDPEPPAFAPRLRAPKSPAMPVMRRPDDVPPVVITLPGIGTERIIRIPTSLRPKEAARSSELPPPVEFAGNPTSPAPTEAIAHTVVTANVKAEVPPTPSPALVRPSPSTTSPPSPQPAAQITRSVDVPIRPANPAQQQPVVMSAPAAGRVKRISRVQIGQVEVQVFNNVPGPPVAAQRTARPVPSDPLERHFLNRFQLRP